MAGNQMQTPRVQFTPDAAAPPPRAQSGTCSSSCGDGYAAVTQEAVAPLTLLSCWICLLHTSWRPEPSFSTRAPPAHEPSAQKGSSARSVSCLPANSNRWHRRQTFGQTISLPFFSFAILSQGSPPICVGERLNSRL